MTQRHKLQTLAAMMLACATLAGCGGGDAESPPTGGTAPAPAPTPGVDTTAPTLTIASNVSADIATGPVTFTFVFSEDVGTTFVAEDITVTGGTASGFTRVSGTQATVVVTPAANSTGTITITVPSGVVADLAGNASKTGVSAEKAFRTVPVINAYLTFDESPAAYSGLGTYGTNAMAEVAAAPAGANEMALKIVKPAGPDTWGGAFMTVPKVPFTATKKAMMAKVYSTVANSVVSLKVEMPGGAVLEVDGTPTGAANTWSTVTWNFKNADLAANYTVLAITPDKNRTTDGAIYYIDNLDVVDTPAAPTTGTVLASFDEATPLVVTEFGGAAYAVEAAPAGGTGNALRITRSGGEPWAGVWIAIPAIPSSVSTQTVSARVYSPVAGVPFVAKAEFADNQGTGDTPANEAVVVGWQTLTWTFKNLNAANTYNRFTLLPQLGTVGSGQVFYVDNITLATTPVAPPTGGTLTFSSGFASNVLTVEGGKVASAGGSNLDGFNCNGDAAWCGSGAGGAGADSFMYFYYQTPSPATALYSQVEVFAPGVTDFSTTGDTGGITLSTQTKVNFTFNPNPEWFNATNNRVAVAITLGKRYAIDGGCRLQLHGVVTPTAVAATSYTMNLRNDFRVAADCGAGIPPTDVAAALAASSVVSSVKFVGAAGGSALLGRNDVPSGANLSVAAGAVFPTTVALKGGITFD